MSQLESSSPKDTPGSPTLAPKKQKSHLKKTRDSASVIDERRTEQSSAVDDSQSKEQAAFNSTPQFETDQKMLTTFFLGTTNESGTADKEQRSQVLYDAHDLKYAADDAYAKEWHSQMLKQRGQNRGRHQLSFFRQLDSDEKKYSVPPSSEEHFIHKKNHSDEQLMCPATARLEKSSGEEDSNEVDFYEIGQEDENPMTAYMTTTGG